MKPCRRRRLLTAAVLWVLAGAALLVLPACAVSPNKLVGWQVSEGPTPPRVVAAQLPRAGLDVVWRVDQADPQQLVATDWSGKPAGWLRFDHVANGIGPQSPDGSRVQVDEALFASDGTLLARHMQNYMWADDSRHVCEIRAEDGGPPNVQEGGGSFSPPPAWLFVSIPGLSRRAIARVGDFSPHGNVTPVACSLKSQRAVVVSTFTVSVTEVRVIDLDRAQLLSTWSPTVGNGGSFSVAVTSDAGLLAENSDTCAEADIFKISRAGAAQRTGHVAGTFVIAFSADGTAVLTRGPFGNDSRSPVAVDVRRWSDGHVAWAGTTGPSRVAIKPTGAGFMLGIASPNSGARFTQTLIVDGSGAAVSISDGTEIATSTGISEAGIGLESSATC